MSPTGWQNTPYGDPGLTETDWSCIIFALLKVVCPSGQRDQTVNLTAKAYAGSNPAATINPVVLAGTVAVERSLICHAT